VVMRREIHGGENTTRPRGDLRKNTGGLPIKGNARKKKVFQGNVRFASSKDGERIGLPQRGGRNPRKNRDLVARRNKGDLRFTGGV